MLKAAGVDFVVQAAEIDERAIATGFLSQGKDAGAIALVLAEQKALAISRQNPGAMVLGGDSVLALEGELISKSPNLASLRAELRRLSG